MNLKRPIPGISPPQNEDRPGDAGRTLRVLVAFCNSERNTALALIAYGILSVVAAGYCIKTTSRWISTSVVPLLVFAIAFFWLGMVVWRRSQSGLLLIRGVHDAGAIPQEYVTRLLVFTNQLHRLRGISAIALVTGICGIIIACVVEALTYSIGIWLATTIQAGLFSFAILTMTFRLEIHAHEISRER